MAEFVPTKAGMSRVFLIEGRARPDHAPDYQSCMRAGAPDQSFGDVEKIECPSPDAYDQFVEIGAIQGAIERGAMDLVGRYASDLESDLLRLARQRCSADVQVHFGACTDPRIFNSFTKALVLEDVYLTNWSTGDLGALASGDNAAVDETSSLSIGTMYEVLPMYFSERGADTVVNPQADVVICSVVSCGDCTDDDSGCDIIYSVAGSTGGSPGTAPDLNYSTDKGVTFSSHDINSLGASDTAESVACIGDYVVVSSASADGLEYNLKATVNAGTAGGWTEVTTGIVAAGTPRDMWGVGNYIFVAGDGGYVYGTADITAGVTALDAGSATANDLNKIHALNDLRAVAVGDSDTIIYTTNRVNWQTATATGGGNNLTAIWMKDEDEWFVGDASGNVYYTLDQGVTWTELTNIPGTYTDINDICFATDSVGYLSGTVSGPGGRILRTYDGGYSWQVIPEGSTSIVGNDAIEGLAACKHDVNFVVGVGLADDGSDGIIVTGQD